MRIITLLLVLFLVVGCSQLPSTEDSKPVIDNLLYCEENLDCFCNCCQGEISEDSTCGLYSQRYLDEHPEVFLVDCSYSNCPASNRRAGSYMPECIENSCAWVETE